ncbi:hypothetical protein I8752_10100 [Nostocaceae cyanobacterium CENA369]|uniref:Uncharacterized protein n=1 Tax=Dendronalium phyllosphericum CENA369 TaxID=1725256 RepID=A0A8J7LES9_9NOST|nr:hypothetical protein [Dendronalium phyllosphericum]MBH8573358.1 hypothetical protein [Dendronalium phyllosphericum CENA369]
MTANSLPLPQIHQDIVKHKSQKLNIQIGQERIYKLLVEVVNNSPPEDALREFKRLFIDCLNSISLNAISVRNGISFIRNEQDFCNTLKRCCYILVNNWASKRQFKYIQELINLLAEYHPSRNSSNSQKISIYKNWLENFVISNDYEELKLFAYRHDSKEKIHWASRYTAYLLIAQSFDRNNPQEQQEAAANLSQQIKDKFKFDLAMFIARSQSTASSVTRYKNPSLLGDNALHLIKTIVIKRGLFSYENLANIFIQQTQNQLLKDFKISIQKYLFFSVNNSQELVVVFKRHLANKLVPWKVEKDEESIDKHLLLRICNRVIDCLTTENGQEPSPLFVLFLSNGNPLTLVIILLKIILICQNARSHLEIRIAHLISYYENFPEEECQSLITFMEIFNITFAIYTENVEYNLIKMKEDNPTCNSPLNLDAYRVFSQLKLDVEY